ncbi:MAG: S-adenosylmethionine:tRNA ribosyltransferase-isomerase [Candidatus Collierbacteria bacterium GW2011_GWB1_44_6]|uniref:S-adenosylmethionine:tRNA ribosyltransferase-isomerase n=2 Tax=Candidatus Collieribacteriota TaxID=1752725 RepID=A0A0G1MNQ8_9BACT|nr:MAG: S-adenosylmethionine:tRNA ribosyltransferase-isomerase [Candidatus Collierbacteria bacterium GW2011_GWC2_43_12]KKT73629.1 MAG: S-adenosylmethionine:tRNA ribosyltransferase-isomerase [Candidatus Collierbacteria bacterium GW2011_GWB1_44_6]KKT84149.1 MAG: S-adenosylmethionine:tRNA ribosyltransferase-isomerase, S-adenosylmethionine:tRNA ribosyltransferase-isomerase [Microgenomates group bacterium GW2011_GWC1_44_9]
MSMNLSDYHFDLPPELIGQEAIEPRDSCKLLVVDRKNQNLKHHIFRDLTDILDKNCVLVINDTKVFPARLFGAKPSGGKIEVLLLKQLSSDSYEAIVKGKVNLDQKIVFAQDFYGVVQQKSDEGLIQIQFSSSGPALFAEIDKQGKTPLPPYIHSDVDEKILREKYQTVYAREKGSAAAPTAGLHFTPELLDQLHKKGIQIEKVTLHVGLGTFKPVTEIQVASKTLHAESYILPEETAQRLNQAKRAGKKIIAVGTTTCRVLETLSDDNGLLSAGEGETSIFIQLGYKFKFVDGLITNFHLPETSLLMLVSALVSAPNSPTHFENFHSSLIGKAYEAAIKNKYKFFSFGDAMMII